MSKWHDEKQIATCCQDYQNGKSVQELLRCYSISKTTLYRWLQLQKVKDTRVSGTNFDRKTISELERQRKMLEIYQKTGLGTGSPFAERVAAIQRLNGEYSLNLLCLTLGISKATYYRAIESKETQFEIKCKTLTPIVEEVFNESKQSYGEQKSCVKKDSLYLRILWQKSCTAMVGSA